MEFRKFQHIERYGTDEVKGINLGTCYIFPKIDGTNASVWLGPDKKLQAGSRKRVLKEGSDNHGFYAFASANEKLNKFLYDNPTYRLYGEWLVPHTLKTYRADAWRKFYVFDVMEETEDNIRYVPYPEYAILLQDYGIDYIPCLSVMTNPSEEDLLKALPHTTFLIEDGKGAGEGIVIKNYDFVNKYGRITWAKIVTNEFKEKHSRLELKEIKTKPLTEQAIVDKFCTQTFIEKEYAKLVAETPWKTERIPELLGRIYSEFIKEEMWNILKTFKNPLIDFKILNKLVVNKIKETKSELF